MAKLTLRLLGGFELITGSRLFVTLPTRKAKALCAYLAMSPDRTHTRGRLAALLWGRSAEEQARASLRQTLSSVRKALASVDAQALVVEGESISLDAAAIETDAVSFRRLLDDGGTDALRNALDLYRGDLLEGFALQEESFEEWLMAERGQLRELTIQGMGKLLNAHLENGATEAGIKLAGRLLSLDPLQESAHRALMRLYAQQGRREAALQQYRHCENVLRRELDVSPAAETRALAEEIRRQRPKSQVRDVTSASELPAAQAAPSQAGEVRQVTVLFARLADLEDLNAHPEKLHAVLTRFFKEADAVVSAYGGRVDKRIGDALMAVFGAPIAHDDDPERGVRAALDIRCAASALGENLGRRCHVHAGVASGQVIAGALGPAGQQEYTVTGDSVTLAWRLGDLAEAGEILVSAAVRDVLAHRIEAEPAGEASIKGVSRTIPVWRLRGLRSEVLPTSSRPIVGRERELHQLRGAMQVCHEAGRGQVIYVRGEAGIGKTRLVEEIQRLAESHGFAGHVARVFDFGVGRGQDAIGALVRSLLGLAADSSVGAREEVVQRMFASQVLDPDQRVFLNDLLDVPQQRELRAMYDAMDHTTRSRGKRETLVTLVGRLAQQHPLFLVVEDIHWADATTLDYLSALSVAVSDCPALLLMTSRTEGDPLDKAWYGSTRGAAFMTVDLGPLRRDEAMTFAEQLADPTNELVTSCVERAEGNPLFLEQLLRDVEDGRGTGLPASLQSLVLARMDRLPSRDREALQAASVIGQWFGISTLRHLLEDPEYDCHALMEHYLVRREGEDYLFAHALIQQGIYASLLGERKHDLHGRAAAWFCERDPILHARHLERAEDPRAPRAYLEAAQAQAASYRYDEALELAGHGLEIAAERKDRFSLACLEGELLRDLGRASESLTVFRKALEMAEEDVERCQAWIGLAHDMRFTDLYQDALEALDNAQSVAERHELAAELAQIHYLRGELYFPLGKIDASRDEQELAVRYARATGSARLEARVLGGLGDACYAQGRLRTAHEHFSRCFELCRQHGLGHIEVANRCMLGGGGTRHYFKDLRGALEESLQAVELAAKVGDQRAEMNAHNSASCAYYWLGELEFAQEHVAQTQALVRRLQARRFMARSLHYQSKILLAQGRREEALSALEEARTISQRTGIGYVGAAVLGTLAVATEDLDKRQRLLAEGERLLGAGSVSHNHLEFYVDAMETMLAAGEWEKVDRYAAALEDYTRPEPLPLVDYFVARARALADYGRGKRNETVLQTLRQLREETNRMGCAPMLPALERALGGGVVRLT